MKRGILILAALSLMLPIGAMAQPGQRMHRPQMRMHQRFLERLGLSDQQKEQVRKLSIEHQKAQTEMMAKIRIARLDLREMLLDDKPDRSAIDRKISGISEMQNQAKLNTVHHLFAVYDLLTPEQQKKVKDLMTGMGMGMQGEGPGGGDQWMGMFSDPPDHGIAPVPDDEDVPSPPSPNSN